MSQQEKSTCRKNVCRRLKERVNLQKWAVIEQHPFSVGYGDITGNVAKCQSHLHVIQTQIKWQTTFHIFPINKNSSKWAYLVQLWKNYIGSKSVKLTKTYQERRNKKVVMYQYIYHIQMNKLGNELTNLSECYVFLHVIFRAQFKNVEKWSQEKTWMVNFIEMKSWLETARKTTKTCYEYNKRVEGQGNHSKN